MNLQKAEQAVKNAQNQLDEAMRQLEAAKPWRPMNGDGVIVVLLNYDAAQWDTYSDKYGRHYERGLVFPRSEDAQANDLLKQLRGVVDRHAKDWKSRCPR